MLILFSFRKGRQYLPVSSHYSEESLHVWHAPTPRWSVEYTHFCPVWWVSSLQNRQRQMLRRSMRSWNVCMPVLVRLSMKALQTMRSKFTICFLSPMFIFIAEFYVYNSACWVVVCRLFIPRHTLVSGYYVIPFGVCPSVLTISDR